MWDKALEYGIWKDICTTSARQWVTNMHDKMEACKLHPTHPGGLLLLLLHMDDACMHACGDLSQILLGFSMRSTKPFIH
jgi:hypothetical protein